MIDKTRRYRAGTPGSEDSVGYTVLDCTVAMAGPFAAQRLGDLGADVVKVEPVEGEWQRRVAAGGGTHQINSSFLSLNRNKRSLAINLKSAEGQVTIHRLVETADVFIQNYRYSSARPCCAACHRSAEQIFAMVSRTRGRDHPDA